MPDFWRSCGYRLLRVGADNRLTLTDDFLRSQLLRPELAPVAESCPAEMALHDKLLAVPRSAVSEDEIAAIDDADARDNYAVWLRFRARLMAASSLEAAYVALFRDGVDVPPLFVAQLTQLILRHLLGDDADPLQARAAEMLFRPQKISLLPDSAVMAADDLRSSNTRRQGLREPRRAAAAEQDAGSHCGPGRAGRDQRCHLLDARRAFRPSRSA
jgi:hypothetical protein